MRKINVTNFNVATRSTSRDINRQIALNLILQHQPLSRADLARRMEKPRGVVTLLVNELIKENLIYEGATGDALRGRKPTFLHIRTHDRLVVAVDVRFSKTYLMLSDFGGRQLALETFNTVSSPSRFIKTLAERINRLIKLYEATSSCEGIGIVVPGIVEHKTHRILNAPTLGWRDVDIRDALAKATNLPVHVENAAKACALAQMWHSKGGDTIQMDNFVHISVSDGIGVGIVINGELLRGHDNIAGEFGHIPLNIDGPPCMCGSRGCWESYASNVSTLSRYLGRNLSDANIKSIFETEYNALTINDLIARAQTGDAKALNAIHTTARYLGLGIATVIHSLNPTCVYIGGEITLVWNLIENSVRAALKERALTTSIANTPIRVATAVDYPRLRGAIALVFAPMFALPRVA